MKTTQTQIRIFSKLRFLHGGSGGSLLKNVAWLLQCGRIMTSNLAMNCCKNFSCEKRNFSFFKKNIFSFYKKRIFFIKIQCFLHVFWWFTFSLQCKKQQNDIKHIKINNILYIMTTELVEDEDSGYELVKRNGEVIAKYPITELKLLKEKFKDICSTPEFSEYKSLDDFIYSIDFLEFLEYFLDYLNKKYPYMTTYKKYNNQITKNELFIMNTLSFKKLINFAFDYLYYSGNDDLRLLYNNINIELNKIKNTKIFKKKEQNILIRLYNGFLYFLELLIERPKDIYLEMTLFTMFKKKLLEGKLIKSQPTFNQSSLTMIYNQFEYNEILEYRKNLLSKFRLFQRKYLSAIAKLRKIGPPNITNKESRDIKKELNKNKNVDYKAYEIFCKYVLNKEENEAIYDYLAGIHKNTFKGVIHKNINNKTVANIKANTKEKHHKEYLERSKAILKMVEAKIEKHGDIIDIKTKHQVKAIRELFDSKQFKNMTFSFGNNLFEQKIIKECKTIRAINKEIDNMIKKHIKKEHINKKQEKREKLLKLLDELKETKELRNNVNIRGKIVDLLGYDLLRKTKKLSQKESNTINQIQNKLNKILPKS